jgi:hypothetical protein
MGRRRLGVEVACEVGRVMVSNKPISAARMMTIVRAETEVDNTSSQAVM